MRPRGPHGQPMFGAVELATWWSRAGALLLDALFAILPILVGIGFAATNASALEVIGVVLIVAGFVWCYFIYYPIFMSRAGERNGQSLGKQIVGIRVVRDTGQPMDYGWSLLRELVVRGLLFGLVGSFFFSIPLLLDYLWPIWDESNRALHDMIVSTHVVRADLPVGPPPPGGVQQQAQQIGLG
jgi:uncharacterized RDD family membrane protein YckC